jgi:L-lactate dehydrogenase complex protein LldG
MVPRGGKSRAELLSVFIQMAQAVDSQVVETSSDRQAVQSILEIIGEDLSVISWELDKIPLDGLQGEFDSRGIQTAAPEDSSVRVGITGVEAALAATGSLVIPSGEGRWRTASLLPPIHIAVVHSDQILPDLEAWVEARRQMGLRSFRETASFLLVTGPSRTSDIGMESIKGMHGPGEVHIVLMDETPEGQRQEQ